MRIISVQRCSLNRGTEDIIEKVSEHLIGVDAEVKS